MSYLVKKAAVPVKLDAAWDSPAWSNAVELKLDYVFDRSSPHHPDTRIKMLYDNRNVYGLFQVKDQYVKAVAEKNQDQVCRDSCVEFFVKPANAGSSVGISKVSNREELKKAVALALENDRKVVFEAFVDGQEVECAVIGSDPAVATRPGEILAGAEFYTYDDKYKNGVSQTVIPAHLPEAKLDEVKTYAAMAYTALNCEGLARCDFFVEKNTGRVLINEINTFPGFTAISMYPKLMEHEGLPVPALIDRLIELALERTEKQHG